MKRIEADDLQCRTGQYSSKEFAQVNDTFNRMINTITNLKIESYERKLAAREAELAAEKAELTSLRMQIQPHFYLNCQKYIWFGANGIISGNPGRNPSAVKAFKIYFRIKK